MPERTKGGGWSKNGQRKGPLTMEARAYWLERILDIQRRVNAAAGDMPHVVLINEEEEARIREMWELGLWPRKWSGDDINADESIDKITIYNNELIVQPRLVE